jgi:hypothetical protein
MVKWSKTLKFFSNNGTKKILNYPYRMILAVKPRDFGKFKRKFLKFSNFFIFKMNTKTENIIFRTYIIHFKYEKI